jgi:hypothetical protein
MRLRRGKVRILRSEERSRPYAGSPQEPDSNNVITHLQHI